MKQLLSPLLLATGLAACTPTTLDARAAVDVEVGIGALEQARKEAQVPRLAVAYVDQGQLQWSRVLGEPARGSDEPVFNLASLTKPLFALMVLQQVADGEFALDDPLATWWVDPDIAGDARHQAITARLALSHQTGLPNWRGKRALSFAFAPGEAHAYSGEGFEYLRRAAEKQSGESMAALMQARVLAPAGMRDTHFGWNDALAPRYAPGDAGPGLDSVRGRGANAAANGFGTAADYGRFLAWVVDGAGLGAALFEDMQRPQARHADPAEQFGLGWKLVPADGAPALWHDGREPGLYNFAFALPGRGEALVMLGNGQHGELLVRPLLKTLLADGDTWLARMDRQLWQYVRSLPGQQLGPMQGFIARSPGFTSKLLHAALTAQVEPLGLDVAEARDAVDALAFAMVDGSATPEQVQTLIAPLFEAHDGGHRVHALDEAAARAWLAQLPAGE